ncbi:hypothetical protein KY362_04835 [Candidatus Woesearchaeota archaeon]|nr:hypothetical protein [Candidatus Woesearchaeota archaeon]
MPKIYVLLNCPKCGHQMKYHTDTRILSGKRKRCVFCGKSISVKDNVLKETARI